MNDVSVTRTPEMVAAEINLIKDQTRKLVLSNSILIGKKLKEAKEMLEPGQFGKWLAEAVDYSQSTANNLMRVYDEYGADQGVLFGSAAKSDVLEKLSYTQAVLLLGVPAEQREDFIQKEHVEEISTRELQAKIKELTMAKEKAEKKANVSAELAQEAAENKKLADALGSQRDALEAETKELRKNLSDKEQETADLEEHIKELEEQLKQPVTVATETKIVEKVPEEVTQELKELREKLALAQEGTAAQKEALELKVEIWAVLNGINKLLEHLDKVQDSKRGAGVRKALESALTQSQNQIAKRLEKFEQEA